MLMTIDYLSTFTYYLTATTYSSSRKKKKTKMAGLELTVS